MTLHCAGWVHCFRMVALLWGHNHPCIAAAGQGQRHCSGRSGWGALEKGLALAVAAEGGAGGLWGPGVFSQKRRDDSMRFSPVSGAAQGGQS